ERDGSFLECGSDFVIRVLWAEVGMFHRLDGFAELMGRVSGGAQGGAGIAGGGLHEHFVSGTECLEDTLVAFDVKRHAARVTKAPGSGEAWPQVMVHERQDDLFELPLHGGGDVDVRFVY